MDLKDSQTKINLMRAFAGESQARNRYEFAAATCKTAGYWFLNNIFTITANQEKEHAEIFYNFLKPENNKNITIYEAAYPVNHGDEPVALLKAAAHNETEAATDSYPEFAKVASEEGFTDIAYAFEQIAKIEAAHAERFKCFQTLLEKTALFKGDENTEWICLNCGHIHTGPTAPLSCPVCNHAQGYFVPYKYYHFIAKEYA
jgi:rubrerythrin